MSSNNPRPTKAERRAAARAQAQAIREEQERKDRRAQITRRSLLGLGVVAVAGAGAAIAVQSSKKGSSSASATTGGLATAKASGDGIPSIVLSDGSWTYGKGPVAGANNGTKAVLDVYFDYSCHYCAAFETLHSPEITTLINSGDITLALHPCKILGMDWTDMVMNAMAVTLEEEPDKALDFHNKILSVFYEIYQAQDASRLTVDTVVSTAQDAGVSTATTDKFQAASDANAYAAWTALGTKTFSDKGFTGTPTIVLNGETLDNGSIGTATALTELLKSKGLTS